MEGDNTMALSYDILREEQAREAKSHLAQSTRPAIQEAIYSVEADSIGEALDAIGYGGWVDYGAHHYWMTYTYNKNFGTWDIAIKHTSWFSDTEEYEAYMGGEKAYALGSRQ